LARPQIDPAHDALHAIERSAVQRLLEMTTLGLSADSDARGSDWSRRPTGAFQ
jgi:hypothetical protein